MMKCKYCKRDKFIEKGMKFTKEHKKKLSEAKKRNPSKNQWKEGEKSRNWNGFQKGHKGFKGMLGRKLTKEQINKALETRQKHGGYPTGEKHHMFGKHPIEETKEKLIKSHLGQKSWNKGTRGLYHHTEEWKIENSKRNKGKKFSQAQIEKIRSSNLGQKRSPETRLKLKESTIRLWKNKEYRDNQLKRVFEGLNLRPTSYEKKISDLCIENNLPFIYTGNGTFLIGHKNPDFVNEKDMIAIEVYHTYFKIRDFDSCEKYEKQRSKYFAKYGWKTIFIRTNEIENKDWKDICLNRINSMEILQ